MKPIVLSLIALMSAPSLAYELTCVKDGSASDRGLVRITLKPSSTEYYTLEVHEELHSRAGSDVRTTTRRGLSCTFDEKDKRNVSCTGIFGEFVNQHYQPREGAPFFSATFEDRTWEFSYEPKMSDHEQDYCTVTE